MYICSNCQKTYSKWQGRCDNCGEWNSLVQDENTTPSKKALSKKKIEKAEVVKLSDLKSQAKPSKNILTSISEFDNALGGRIVDGQVILFAGEPGIGKSTLCLEAADKLSKQGTRVLYICGEESPSQIKTRADRLKYKLENVSFLSSTNSLQIEDYVASKNKSIDFIIVDSIQTLSSPDIASNAGSISQISDSTNKLVSLAKGYSIPTMIIGHVTKSGDIAGPKILEHMVDTVIYFEGDKKHSLRMIRIEKNRFGPTDEVGLFIMTSSGLKEVSDPKELFDSSKPIAPGSVYSMVMEGSRPIVVEIQALATKTYFSHPRRTTSGFELNRLYLLLAILDKKLRLKTYEYDVYVNITGGISVKDPALDLAVIQAIYSSIKSKPVEKKSIYFGEVGLTGELRKVIAHERRIKEAKRLGFEIIKSKSKEINFINQVIN